MALGEEEEEEVSPALCPEYKQKKIKKSAEKRIGREASEPGQCLSV